MSKRACERCEWWQCGFRKSGSCLRYPPRDESDGRRWPVAHADEWCGEFKEAGDAKLEDGMRSLLDTFSKAGGDEQA